MIIAHILVTRLKRTKPEEWTPYRDFHEMVVTKTKEDLEALVKHLNDECDRLQKFGPHSVTDTDRRWIQMSFDTDKPITYNVVREYNQATGINSGNAIEYKFI